MMILSDSGYLGIHDLSLHFNQSLAVVVILDDDLVPLEDEVIGPGLKLCSPDDCGVNRDRGVH